MRDSEVAGSGPDAFEGVGLYFGSKREQRECQIRSVALNRSGISKKSELGQRWDHKRAEGTAVSGHGAWRRHIWPCLLDPRYVSEVVAMPRLSASAKFRT